MRYGIKFDVEVEGKAKVYRMELPSAIRETISAVAST
jgi:hypothetical protein